MELALKVLFDHLCEKPEPRLDEGRQFSCVIAVVVYGVVVDGVVVVVAAAAVAVLIVVV